MKQELEPKAAPKLPNKKEPDRGSTELLAGLGFGAYGGISLVTIGTICPACIVATPFFLATGIYKRLQKK